VALSSFTLSKTVFNKGNANERCKRVDKKVEALLKDLQAISDKIAEESARIAGKPDKIRVAADNLKMAAELAERKIP